MINSSQDKSSSAQGILGEPSKACEDKPNPFYVSLLLNGHKLSNYIIDLGASDNIMPSSIAKTLGLTLTKSFGRCYSKDGK